MSCLVDIGDCSHFSRGVHAVLYIVFALDWTAWLTISFERGLDASVYGSANEQLTQCFLTMFLADWETVFDRAYNLLALCWYERMAIRLRNCPEKYPLKLTVFWHRTALSLFFQIRTAAYSFVTTSDNFLYGFLQLKRKIEFEVLSQRDVFSLHRVARKLRFQNSQELWGVERLENLHHSYRRYTYCRRVRTSLSAKP